MRVSGLDLEASTIHVLKLCEEVMEGLPMLAFDARESLVCRLILE